MIRILLSFLLIAVGLLVLSYWQNGWFSWLHIGGVKIKAATAAWFILSAMICVLQETSQSAKRDLAIFVSCGLGVVTVCGSLALYSVGNDLSASPATMFCFTVFWTATILQLIQQWKILNCAGWLLMLAGFVAVTGHILHIPLMYFDFEGRLNAMAFSTAVCMIILGFNTYLQQKKGEENGLNTVK